MGSGSYTSSDWDNLRAVRNITQTSTVTTLYTSTNLKRQYDPKYIRVRESCDSADNPKSTPVIIGLDVTGSMGYLSEAIAKDALNRTMMELYDKQPITNPHIMFAAIGDSKCDKAPLQVTQYEADIRIAEQLLDIWFEGRGGGNGGESYSLLWYFAAKHTKIDSFEKRGRKGIIITIGDESCHKTVSPEEIRKVFPDGAERDYSSSALYGMAAEMYDIYHIHLTRPGTAGQSYDNIVFNAWNALIPGRVACLGRDKISHLPEVLISLMLIAGGMSAADAVKQWPFDKAYEVRKALADIRDVEIPVERVYEEPAAPEPKKPFWKRLF